MFLNMFTVYIPKLSKHVYTNQLNHYMCYVTIKVNGLKDST